MRRRLTSPGEQKAAFKADCAKVKELFDQAHNHLNKAKFAAKEAMELAVEILEDEGMIADPDNHWPRFYLQQFIIHLDHAAWSGLELDTSFFKFQKNDGKSKQ